MKSNKVWKEITMFLQSHNYINITTWTRKN
jgi:hypothetical protein